MIVYVTIVYMAQRICGYDVCTSSIFQVRHAYSLLEIATGDMHGWITEWAFVSTGLGPRRVKGPESEPLV